MLGRWDPFADLARSSDEMFRNFARDARTAVFAPPVDIYEDKDVIVLQAELPGVKQEDVSIQVEEGVLTLSGERKSARTDDRNGVHRVERVHGKFARSFSLPKTVDPARIEASLDAGVLTLRIPRRAELAPRKIAVQIGTRATSAASAPSTEAKSVAAS